MKKFLPFVLIALLFTSCNSIFSGSTGGIVVDAESTSVPKQGIANVDVYAYTDSGARDSDFKSWKEGYVFTPKASYYGHTVTGGDGSFSISKLVWEKNPFETTFGKDADVTRVYLLFYHENFGLTKGETLILSDSYSDSVYMELTSVRKTTAINLNFEDVATGNNTGNQIYAEITVPQEPFSSTPKIYKVVVNGSGVVNVNYPRYQADKTTENVPEIKITYYQNCDEKEVTWKACLKDEKNNDFSFIDTVANPVEVNIRNDRFPVTLYGKSTELRMPSIKGQYKNSDNSNDDGLVVSLKAKDKAGAYSIDCGQVSTESEFYGSASVEKHGMFNGLGAGFTWTDDSYTGKYAEIDVDILVEGVSKKKMTLRSDMSSYTVQL